MLMRTKNSLIASVLYPFWFNKKNNVVLIVYSDDNVNFKYKNDAIEFGCLKNNNAQY